MYSLVTSVLKERHSNKPWSEVDLNRVTVREFFKNYISGYVVLTNISLPGEHIVDYQTFVSMALPQPILDIDFPAWLALINNRVLPTIKEPEFFFGEAWFSDINKAGWRYEKAHPVSPSTENYTDADLTDALLIKPTVPMDIYGDYILTTQNGLFHFSYPTVDGLKVRDMTQSFYSSKKNNPGVMSFTDIGKLKQIPLTEDNIISVSDDDNMMREFYVNAEMDLTGKTVWLSLGGYLHTDKSDVFTVNDETGLVGINLSKVDIPRRVAHSSQLIDLSSLGIFLPDLSPTLFDLDALRTREVMMKYLTISQTFLIVIDTQNVDVQLEEIEYTGVVGVYKTQMRRSYAIRNQYGILQYYAAGKVNDNKMSVLTPPDLMKYSDYDTESWVKTPRYGEDYRLRFNDNYPVLNLLRIISTSMVRA